MDWIKEHKTLAGILGVAGAGAIGLGVMVWNSYTAYVEGLDNYDTVSKALGRIESAPLYPSKENMEKKKAMVQQFRGEVEKLQQTLLNLQPPLKDITDTDFQAKLKQRMAETRAKTGSTAEEGGKIPKNFAFGFDLYVNSLPPQAAAKDLNDYLDAVDSIVQMALDSGVKKITALSRSDVASEKSGASSKAAAPDSASSFMTGQTTPQPSARGTKSAVAAAPSATKVVERRTVKINMVADQPAFQTFMNDLASASKMLHFTVVRVLRVENDKLTGPTKAVEDALNKENKNDTASTGASPGGAPPGGDQPAVSSGPEVLIAPKAAPADAVIVMGGEMLNVYVEIDIIKYIDSP
ncbi:MAG: Amuc_1100 family pilus-like protein [Verrucomicrobiaceae bacterium]|nr:Amuc_1100 family pilus-like protein [Verrucomicrobiaceae bacterium]